MMIGLSLGLCSTTGQGGVPNPLPAIWANGELGDYWEAFGLTGTVDTTVQTMAGKLGRHPFTQTTAGNRPTLKVRADGVRYLDFASGKSMFVATSTALFNYLHDGTGGEVIAFIEYPQSQVVSDFLKTSTGTAAAGIIISKTSGGQFASIAVTRAVSGQAVVNTAASDLGLQISPSGRLVMFSSAYKYDGGSSDYSFGMDSCRSMITRASAFAPTSANAAINLTIDATFGGRLYALLVINRRLTPTERLALYRYWRSKIEYTVSNVALNIAIQGQSNARGAGLLTPVTLPTKEGVYIYDKAEEYRLLFEPSHANVNQPVPTSPNDLAAACGFSFALAAGTKLKDDAGVNVVVAPGAVGSTTWAQWDTPATVNDPTTLFGALITRWKKVRTEKGGQAVLVTFGHESGANLPVADYVNGGVGTAYQSACASFIAHVRAEMGNVPVIMIQLASDDDLSTAVSQALVGEAQRQLELSLSNVYLVVAHDLARNTSPDDVHVAQAGQKVEGERAALSIMEHVLGLAVNGTGPRNASVTYSGSTVTLTLNKAINTTAGDYGNLFRVYANGVEQTVSSAGRNGSDTSKIDIVCSAPLTGPITLTYCHRAGPASAARTDLVKDSDGLPLPVFGPIAVPAA